MLDTNALNKLIEEQINQSVSSHVEAIFQSNEWQKPIEEKIVKYSQDRILGKFNNSTIVPEIIDTVKSSVEELFASGKIPGIDTFIDYTAIKQAVDYAVENTIDRAVKELSLDSVWLEKIERQVNQAIVQRTIAGISSIDVKSVIKDRVDVNMKQVRQDFLTDFNSTGITDQATSRQLTITDDNTVVENKLTAKELSVVESLSVKHLSVKGSINTDNQSWDSLARVVSEKTLAQLTDDWRQKLVSQVAEEINSYGINFDKVKIDGHYVVEGSKLSDLITETNIEKVGTLKNLSVSGSASINDTFNVVNKRVGINTESPESALSVWDEEVNVLVGKHKNKQAYIGTSRDHGLAIGVNRLAQLEIDATGLTTIKKLQVGLHKISHGLEVPNYSGTRGDIVFNANPTTEVFAWVCLGGFRWKLLRAVE